MSRENRFWSGNYRFDYLAGGCWLWWLLLPGLVWPRWRASGLPNPNGITKTRTQKWRERCRVPGPAFCAPEGSRPGLSCAAQLFYAVLIIFWSGAVFSDKQRFSAVFESYFSAVRGFWGPCSMKRISILHFFGAEKVGVLKITLKFEKLNFNETFVAHDLWAPSNNDQKRSKMALIAVKANIFTFVSFNTYNDVKVTSAGGIWALLRFNCRSIGRRLGRPVVCCRDLMLLSNNIKWSVAFPDQAAAFATNLGRWTVPVVFAKLCDFVGDLASGW